MDAIKQDMPPSGGFAKIQYERIPLKNPWPSPVKWLIFGGMSLVGFYLYCLDKKRIKYEEIEKKAATFSIAPMLVAENDRIKLRNIIRARKEEAEVMKNVEGWEVGTLYGEPIYKTMKPNQWYDPDPMEIWMYSDLKYYDYSKKLRRFH